jgi:hypothetical protein
MYIKRISMHSDIDVITLHNGTFNDPAYLVRIRTFIWGIYVLIF